MKDGAKLSLGLYSPMSMSIWFALTWALLLSWSSDSYHALAAPSVGLVRRGGGGTRSSTWVPIVVVLVAVAALVVYVGSRRRQLRNLAERAAPLARSARARASGRRTSQVREVTAEQLTGVRPAAYTGQNQQTGNGVTPATNTRNTARRGRRPGRTPSQMSTRSLPVYMKEPGENELVIYQGDPDMEDAPPIDDPEDRITAARIAIHPTQSETPLLRSESNDSSNNHLLSPNLEGMVVRASLETIDDSMENDLQPQQTIDISDLPPNYTITAEEQSPEPDASNAATVGRSPGGPARDIRSHEPATARRRAGLRTLLNAMSHPVSRIQNTTSASTPSAPTTGDQPRSSHGHNRDNSLQSVETSGSGSTHSHLNSNEGTRANRRPTHRANQSSNGSILGLTSSAFRTLSRQRSTNTLNSAHLNSPSTISLHSISAPLSHTLTRTEIVYPRSGPTPEQIKLISSRESLGRFGVPYGPDAIAYAASSSRLNLSLPPPDFDSSIAEGARPQTGRSSESSGEQEQARPSTPPPQPHGHSPESTTSLEPSPEEPAESTAPVTNTEEPKAPVPARTEEKAEEGNKEIASPTSPEPDIPRDSATEAPGSTPAAVPPSSFKPALDSRAESRASTVQSFATAEESPAALRFGVEPPTPNASSPSTSEPSTPRIAPAHTHEPTDVIIMPARPEAAVP
ncbi:hypothetical protein NEOLEDRAFT_1244014 [Neolentinus lepideus HHB14362 ss-1]|uniref:Proteophosphoglycan ppg4 n=1 Tax=Neolentinus lepideus HHB14362 ss-1 TaxID=1314782 RepID=A0A165QE17_9AGAM|nr:hypothetical protein NEOLEDRAFT_1244014 [Neolentinus lepideus HHB14362 ss-1]